MNRWCIHRVVNKNLNRKTLKASLLSLLHFPSPRQYFSFLPCVIFQGSFMHIQIIQGHILPPFLKQIIAYYILCFVPCFFSIQLFILGNFPYEYIKNILIYSYSCKSFHCMLGKMIYLAGALMMTIYIASNILLL